MHSTNLGTGGTTITVPLDAHRSAAPRPNADSHCAHLHVRASGSLGRAMTRIHFEGDRKVANVQVLFKPELSNTCTPIRPRD